MEMRLAKFLEGLDNPMKAMGNFDSPKYSWWWGTLVPGRNSAVHHPATAVSSGAANARDCSPHRGLQTLAQLDATASSRPGSSPEILIAWQGSSLSLAPRNSPRCALFLAIRAPQSAPDSSFQHREGEGKSQLMSSIGDTRIEQ